MKKIGLFILLALFSLMSFSQVQEKQKSNVEIILETTGIHLDRQGNEYDWKMSNETCYGCGAFRWAVTRTHKIDEEGKYWFYVLIWSNSFYENGLLTSSYITGMHLHVRTADNLEHHVLGPFWVLAPPKTDLFQGITYAAHVWSYEPEIIVDLLWDKVEAY